MWGIVKRLFARNMNSMTEYEQRETKKEIKRLAKLVKEGCEND